MRKSSVHSVRASTASTSSVAAHAANTYLLEKMKEFDALAALERASSDHVRRLERIDVDCNLMADAGRVHGDVLSQWPEMFRLLSLAIPRPNAQTAPNSDADEPQACELLVRVPLDELQNQDDSRTK